MSATKSEPPSKKKKSGPQVICVSRRTDICNPQSFDEFVRGLEAGTITYHHPHFARNPHNDRFCTTSLIPDDVLLIDWWSKDFSLLRSQWDAHPVFANYKHRFVFTINGEARSILEPGLESSLADRLDQLAWLVSKFPDPNSSILVHVDPIVIYRLPGSDEIHDNLAHVPALLDKMRTLGLTRIHMSFMQFAWRQVKSRVDKFRDRLDILDITAAEQVALFRSHFVPFAAGIRVQTCTATSLIDAGLAVQGACTGWEDVVTIAGEERVGPAKVRTGKTAATRQCTCYPFKDVGSQRNPCKHGCRYCFEHPGIIDW